MNIKKILFSLHTYVGLIAALILSIVGVSGALLSFEDELTSMINKRTLTVLPKENALDTQTVLDIFLRIHPNKTIVSIVKESSPHKALIIRTKDSHHHHGKPWAVNPYTAEILGTIKGEKFFHTVQELHRFLLMGKTGKAIVGASVLAFLFLLLSGVYLYVPRIKKGLKKALTFSNIKKGRTYFLSIHGALGLWLLPLYLLLILTGLHWSYGWYKGLLYQAAGVPIEHKKRPPKPSNNEPTVFDSADVAYALQHFEKSIKYTRLFLRISPNVYTFMYRDKTTQEKGINFYQYNTKTDTILRDERYIDMPFNKRILKSIKALHTGAYFGLMGKVLLFIASVLLPVIIVTGFILYKKRAKSASNQII